MDPRPSRSSRTTLTLGLFLVLLGVCYLAPVSGLIAIALNVALVWCCRMWRPRAYEP